jgi:hypothetical protein
VKNPRFLFAGKHLVHAVLPKLGGVNACNSHVMQQPAAV